MLNAEKQRVEGPGDRFWTVACVGVILFLAGCSAQHYRKSVDQVGYEIIQQKQIEALGKTNAFTVETAADRLRQRLLIDQNLPHSSPASLGSQYLDPIEHWPKDDYLASTNRLVSTNSTQSATNGPVVLTLTDALQVAAQNSRQYQSQKESVFRSALDLDLERDRFNLTFAGVLGGSYSQDRSGLAEAGGTVDESLGASADFSALQRLKSGAELSFALGWNLIKLLEPENFTSDSVMGDASISIPLLRGAGRHIAMESLTQAERNVIYAIYDFEEFKRSFAVDIASSYFSVLESQNQVTNAADNYESLVTSARRARRLQDAGELPAIQVDQAIQDELSARNNWVSARESFASALDAFKFQLGLPVDAAVELDKREFERISEQARGVVEGATEIEYDEEIPPADAPVELKEPSQENAGPMELEPERAIHLALENRLDLRIAQGEVYDALRGVVIAADRLRPELTLFGSASFSGDDFSDFRFDEGAYTALLNIDLPLERTAEAIAYRSSYFALESAVRGVQDLEDGIKLDVINQLRDLREARESLRIQALSVELAERRVRGAELNLQAGRAQIRDLLEAQADFLSAKNSFASAAVNYRIGELELQRDLGVLEVNAEGLWTEFQPETVATNEFNAERNANETTIN